MHLGPTSGMPLSFFNTKEKIKKWAKFIFIYNAYVSNGSIDEMNVSKLSKFFQTKITSKVDVHVVGANLKFCGELEHVEL